MPKKRKQKRSYGAQLYSGKIKKADPQNPPKRIIDPEDNIANLDNTSNQTNQESENNE